MAEREQVSGFEGQDDAALVRRIQSQDTAWPEAANALLARHRHAILRRCWSRLGNKFDAEDALQEALARAFRAIAGFKGDAEFKTWLYAIADNQCSTLLARRARYQMSDHLRTLIDIHQKANYRPSTEEHGLSVEVGEALKKISCRDREILTLRFYGDQSIEDLATTLGIKLSAAKMRLYRAMRRFEACYRDQAGVPYAVRSNAANA